MSSQDYTAMGMIVGMVLIVGAGLVFALSMGPNDHTMPSASKQASQTTGSR